MLLAAIQAGIATALLGSLWQVTALTASAWLVLALLDRYSAGLRHSVAMLFLLACAAAPIFLMKRISRLLMPEARSSARWTVPAAALALSAWMPR